MHLKNDSDVPEPLLNLMAGFIEKRSPAAKSCMVEVISADKSTHHSAVFARSTGMMTGVAIKGGGWARQMPKKHLVQVFIPEGFAEAYDAGEQSFTVAGTIESVTTTAKSWDEELTLVWSHELRHVWQYENGCHRPTMGHPDDELDAERYASEVVAQYRPWRNRYFCRAAAKLLTPAMSIIQ